MHICPIPLPRTDEIKPVGELARRAITKARVRLANPSPWLLVGSKEIPTRRWLSIQQPVDYRQTLPPRWLLQSYSTGPPPFSN